MTINFQKLNRFKQKDLYILILCLLVGFSLRFYAFDHKSLWIDEIHTFNESRDNFNAQIEFYKKNPTSLHPPLFFVLTHLFYPFTQPERDLRIIPLIFGTLSLPMMYFLTRSFSPPIALPCTLSLTFMAYHISLSQDGRSYSLVMFLGMTVLYFFMKHLGTSRRKYLFPLAFCYALLFHTSYSSIPFIAFSQILWFYQSNKDHPTNRLTSFFILNGLTLLFCLPWILFVTTHYSGQQIMDPLHTESAGSFWSILYGIFHDWVPHAPLTLVSLILLILFPIFSVPRRNASVLLAVFLLPVVSLFLFCYLSKVTHFMTSRYFISFMPVFLISLYQSLDALELKFEKIKRWIRFKILFVILFILSNLVILPLYYRSEKQDFKGLVAYLKTQLIEGDKIFAGAEGYIPGILHYFGVYPEDRHYVIPFWKDSEKTVGYWKSFTYRNRMFTIYNSKTCCAQYVADKNRLWIIVGARTAGKLNKESPTVFKGYFDGSFLNLTKFPTNASMYLFLWDPSSLDEKGIEMPIEQNLKKDPNTSLGD
jgi:hypothetical protein